MVVSRLIFKNDYIRSLTGSWRLSLEHSRCFTIYHSCWKHAIHGLSHHPTWPPVRSLYLGEPEEFLYAGSLPQLILLWELCYSGTIQHLISFTYSLYLRWTVPIGINAVASVTELIFISGYIGALLIWEFIHSMCWKLHPDNLFSCHNPQPKIWKLTSGKTEQPIWLLVSRCMPFNSSQKN